MPEPIQLHPYDPGWPAKFEAEKARVLSALGGLTWETGGVALAIEHVGSTAVPGLDAKPCVDIALAAHPFPLAEGHVKALEALGYAYKGENGIPGRQYFRRGPHEVHLHVFEAGDWRFDEHVLFRDYLRADAGARDQFQSLKRDLAAKFRDDRAAYTDGKAGLVRELTDQAHRWHVAKTGFGPVEWLRRELEGLEVPWFVASGWALDLFAGEASRLHQDLDLSVWRKDQQAVLAHLKGRGFDLKVVRKGQYSPWQPGEWLSFPEVTQVHARRADLPSDLLDVMFSEHDERDWWYRREPKVRMPMGKVILETDGIPVMNPAIILLFKSRTSGNDPRAKDVADFDRTLPLLSDEQKAWLRGAFEVWMPGHPWKARL